MGGCCGILAGYAARVCCSCPDCRCCCRCDGCGSLCPRGLSLLYILSNVRGDGGWNSGSKDVGEAVKTILTGSASTTLSAAFFSGLPSFSSKGDGFVLKLSSSRGVIGWLLLAVLLGT